MARNNGHETIELIAENTSAESWEHYDSLGYELIYTVEGSIHIDQIPKGFYVDSIQVNKNNTSVWIEQED